MGFLDKAKAGLNNTVNYSNQKIDEAKFNSDIYEKKSQKKKYLEEAGEKIYVLYLNGDTVISEEIEKLFAKAKECDEAIERLEKEKAEMVENAKNERKSTTEDAKNN